MGSGEIFLHIGPIIGGCLSLYFGSRWGYVVMVTSKSPKVKIGSTLNTLKFPVSVHTKPNKVVKHPVESQDHHWAWTIIGHGAALNIRTNASLFPSPFFTHQHTEYRASSVDFDLNKMVDLVPTASQRRGTMGMYNPSCITRDKR